MKIVEIAALPNGAHNNQTIDGADSAAFPVPAGWAIIPEDMVCENFPFGSFEVVEVYGNGVLYVKEDSWIPGVIPEPEPMPEPEPAEPSVWDELQAAYEEGVNSVD